LDFGIYGDKLGLRDMNFEKSFLALLAGFGVVAILAFFYFFMRDKSTTMMGLSIIVIILSILMMLFLLFDKLKFSPSGITDKNSNLVAGMVFALVFFILIMTFTEWVKDIFDSVLIVILTALTACTSFLLLYSLGMDD
jgi:multidrug transporter EmrE-like cation transporter